MIFGSNARPRPVDSPLELDILSDLTHGTFRGSGAPQRGFDSLTSHVVMSRSSLVVRALRCSGGRVVGHDLQCK